MKWDNFAIELGSIFSIEETLYARTLYQAVVGKEAISLYMAFYDYYLLLKNNKKLVQISELLFLLQINQDQFNTLRSKLEAVGLVRTFWDGKQNQALISINKPLSPNLFYKNKMLFGHLADSGNNPIFEKLHAHCQVGSSKNETFEEITNSYHDVFETPQYVTNTLEINLSTNLTNEKAINQLSFSQYVKFALNREIWPSLYNNLLKIGNLGFSNTSVNLFVDHSIKVNNKVVINYILKIAKSFVEKGIVDAGDVKVELEESRDYNLTTIKPIETEAIVSKSKSNVNWDEILFEGN